MHPTSLRPGSAGEHALQQLHGTAERAERFYRQQVRAALNRRMREFLARQEMMFLATSDAAGACDSTFRAGPPGFVRCLNPETVAWPEYRGNGVMASLGNISENGHVGLLFVDFVHDGIGLHVNGTAEIVTDRNLRAEHPELPTDPAPGRRAEQWVLVHVEEAYVHCAKHIPRLALAAPGETARRRTDDYFGTRKDQT
ncbi:pyridoxamine 5'-phosphate oxidase family protein [Longispora sp. K20-0274]|uniref:pyridoxamine 5'-phosphate oxidase family protein n=1 Tax=Longispora sp. K20-0274 TaxID=3088255 RepID=UPI00399B6CA4